MSSRNTRETQRADAANPDYPGKGTIKSDDQGVGPGGIVPNLRVLSVVAIFDRDEQAEAAIGALERRGYNRADISMVRRGRGTPPELPANSTEADKGAVAGAGVGAVIGGAVGVGLLALAGLGPVVIAGPLLAAIGGAVTGGALGALAGSLAGLGVPNERAKHYEQAVREGGVLVALQAADAAEADRVSSLLTQQGARDVECFKPAL
jgi:hypothetical protein